MKFVKLSGILLLLSSCFITQDKKSTNKGKTIWELLNGSTTEELQATSAVKVTPEVIQNYIQTYKTIAMIEMRKYRIPASITLAQGILESGSGQSRLARLARNHFGIKCHIGWEGETITHDDDHKGECFRKYSKAEDSFEDHSLFLVNRPRYDALFQLRDGDYKGWAHGLKKAGYATDSKYPNKLINLIEKYKLHQYDQIVMGTRTTEEPLTPIQTQTTTTKPISTNKSVAVSGKNKKHIVKAGDTLYRLAKAYGVSVESIMKINRLKSSSLSVGQELLIPVK